MCTQNKIKYYSNEKKLKLLFYVKICTSHFEDLRGMTLDHYVFSFFEHFLKRPFQVYDWVD